jgi:hypothetical protein
MRASHVRLVANRVPLDYVCGQRPALPYQISSNNKQITCPEDEELGTPQ